jgi:DNA-binding LacI/PurR family transcriptional regulator
MSTPRPRLRDVAERAGVSVKTVSNVINDYPHITEKTRTKVEAALGELNYRMNVSAKALSTGRSGFIAFALPGLDNPYFAQLADSVIQAAAAENWTVLIEQTRGAPDAELQVIDGVMPYLVDGIVLHLESLSSAELSARTDTTPLVLIGEKFVEGVADHVAADNVAASFALTKHLLDSGRRRIAVVGLENRTGFATAAMRYQGYSDALSTVGLAPRPEYTIIVDHLRRADGPGAVDRLLALPEPPDAIVCFNDLLAIGALSRLHRLGIDVPGQIALAGFDNADEGAYSTPSLTSVAWDTTAIATRAIALLSERSQAEPDEQPPHRDISVGYELVLRDSTGVAG